MLVALNLDVANSLLDGPELCFENIAGNRQLEALNLVVAPREMVMMVGRSGIGKTTALRLAAGLERTNSGHRRLDALAVDSGYRPNTVYAWAPEYQHLYPDTGYDLILATKGLPGWGNPAIGQPTLVDVDLGGKRIKQGCKVWCVGTWPIKADFYSFLRQEGIQVGAQRDPDGYCHFAKWVDDVYFRQLVGDRLEQVKVQGRIAGQRWAQIKDNHFHYCRIYNQAMA